MSQKVIQIPGEFKPLFDTTWREAAIYGGRFSLKSHTVARFLLIKARMQTTRIGCFREYQNSISESSHQLLADLIKLYELKEFKVTDKTIVNEINGSEFLFKGMHHNEQSIKSLEGLDIAWVEEAQTVSKSSIEILTPTVRKPGSQIIYTYNRLLEDDPVHQRLVIEGRPNSLIINVNYDVALKYGMMPDSVRMEMEDDKVNRPTLYRHKWLGEPNSLEMLIYRDWNIIDDVPADARLERRGLDFGYTNDPTALIDIYKYNGGYIWDEQLYRKGMTNKQIADLINNLPRPSTLVIGDSAEPKSIDEIKLYGVPILPAIKGPDSVRQGIQLVQSLPISVTRRSVNTINERKKYFWKTDRDGRILQIPEDINNHCFAPETLIATTEGELPISSLVGKSGFLISRDGKVKHYHSVRPTRHNTELVHLTFDDNRTLSVTPDHLLLQPDGTWKEAGLYKPTDLIQSATYATNIQWKDLPTLLWRKIFKQGDKASASCSVGTLQRAGAKRLSRSPQGFEPAEQRHKQSRTKNGGCSLERAYDTGTSRPSKQVGKPNTPSYKAVALIRRGQGVAQVTWDEDYGTTTSYFERVRSLSLAIRNQSISFISTLLSSKLQNESTTKAVVRVARGRAAITYNLEVDGTHCLLADGVIAHNSMDAGRYAMQSLYPHDSEGEQQPLRIY